jgi:hypothetical protein
MPRMTKGMIAAANSELACIWELATEQGNPEGACLRYHASSATRYITTLRKAGQPLPEFSLANIRFLQAMGWRFDEYIGVAG